MIMCAEMNGGDAMDEDGALPSAAPTQPPELNFDADITPEEMQMMATMGIPFGFDTTQVQLWSIFLWQLRRAISWIGMLLLLIFSRQSSF